MLARSSERENSDSKGDASKLETQKRKHKYSCFHKNQKRSILRTGKYGDLTTAEHKILTKEVNLGTITDTLSWYKFSPLDGIRVKPRLHRRRRRIYESSCSRRRSQKLFIRTIYWNLASIVKNCHRIIKQLHFNDQRQAEFQNELHVEQKKRHQPYHCNLDRMISGSRIL